VGVSKRYGEELARAMVVEGSLDLGACKAGHIAEYVARTVTKAIAVVIEERWTNRE